jgi:multiple sugar transport system ATP-binding protein
MNVFDNMAFGLKLRKVARDDIDRRVRRAADMLGIADLLPRRPRHLSGGQRQRVAMGRAIVREAAAFLMDEPLSNLDAKLRVQMRSEIRRLHHRLGTTTLYVTHDQVEAMTMGDRVAVLRQGALQQIDTPQSLYDAPVNLFVAGFIGSPAMNMVPARVAREEGVLWVIFGSRRLSVAVDLPEGDVILGLRPEDIDDAAMAERTQPGTTIESTVILVEPLGAELLVQFEVDAPPARTEHTLDLAADLEPGADAGHHLAAERALFTARLSPRSSVKVGERATLVVDVSRLYYFDPLTGAAIR